jgi:hypothetical protein
MTNEELLKRAREIVAVTYVRMEYGSRETTPDGSRPWNDHVMEYAQFIRDGAYDDQWQVQIALAALKAGAGA